MWSVRTRVVVLCALLVLITQAITVSAILRKAHEQNDLRVRQEPQSAAAVIEDSLQQRTATLTAAVNRLANEGSFQAMAAAGSLPPLAVAVETYRQAFKSDLALVVDDEGRVVLSSGIPVPGRLPVSELQQQGIQPVTGILVSGDDYIARLVVAPIQLGARTGWVALGFLINDVLIQQLQKRTHLDVAFSLPSTPAKIISADPSRTADEFAAANLSSDTLTPRLFTHADHQYVVTQRSIGSRPSQIQALLFRATQDAEAPYRELWQLTGAFCLTSLCLGAAGAGLVARRLPEALLKLTAAAQPMHADNDSPVIFPAADSRQISNALESTQTGIADREKCVISQAHFDPLTRLPNRLLALERLSESLGRAARNGESVTLIQLGFAEFGKLRASLGQDLADSLIAHAAERLRDGLDARHTLARLEAEEFLIILQGVGTPVASAVAEDLLRLVNAGVSAQNVNVNLRAVAGLSTFPDNGTLPVQLVRRAAIARTEAEQSEHWIHVYDNGAEENCIRQVKILGDLRQAARQDELKLFLQPKISLLDGQICGAEGLVRWDHPTLGWLLPSEFIPIAERSGNISLVTRWALPAAVRECRIWLEEGLDLDISVNLSTRDLQDEKLPQFIHALLRDHDLSPEHLILEITEEALLRDAAHANRVLNSLRDIGVKVSIDDFGTGYSSLGHIRNLPIDEIKIDRSFVQGLPGNPVDVAIVAASLKLAHTLDIGVVAEGVETTPAKEWLAAHLCDTAQGYLVSPPMPAQTFTAWVRRYSAAGPLKTALPRANSA